MKFTLLIYRVFVVAKSLAQIVKTIELLHLIKLGSTILKKKCTDNYVCYCCLYVFRGFFFFVSFWTLERIETKSQKACAGTSVISIAITILNISVLYPAFISCHYDTGYDTENPPLQWDFFLNLLWFKMQVTTCRGVFYC